MAVYSSPAVFDQTKDSLRNQKSNDEDLRRGGGDEGIDKQS